MTRTEVHEVTGPKAPVLADDDIGALVEERGCEGGLGGDDQRERDDQTGRDGQRRAGRAQRRDGRRRNCTASIENRRREAGRDRPLTFTGLLASADSGAATLGEEAGEEKQAEAPAERAPKLPPPL